ncbi:MAG: hypothetical protein EXR48_04065 [Dehalococcoidia bacterium]|nr:hypothetical protein [Dehalococcoidia bacterium]
MRNLGEENRAVIVGRASNLVLKDRPESLHVGVVAPLGSTGLQRSCVGKTSPESRRKRRLASETAHGRVTSARSTR